jgi:4-amino-4-deoxy-L-arabinose transferase-like glycosyltransferase
MNEHIYLPVTLSAILILVMDLKKPGWVKLILAGIFLGLSDLSRGVFFLFPFTLLLFYLVAGKSIVQSLAKTVIVLAAAAAVVLPWTYRNYQVVGYPVPIGTTAGSGLYAMNSPIADPYTTQLIEMPKEHPEWVNLHPNTEVATYLAGSKYAMEWIRSDFRRFVKLGAGKLIAFFGLNKTWTNYDNLRGSSKFNMDSAFIEATDQILKYYFAFHFLWFLVGACLLVRFSFRDSVGDKMFLLFVTLFIVGMHFLFAGWPRYRYPLEPLIYSLSAFAIVYLLDSSKIMAPDLNNPTYVESHSSTVC